MTVGPWKPIRLESYSTRITEVDVRSTVSQSLEASVKASFSFTESSSVSASVELYDASGNSLGSQTGMKLSGGKGQTGTFGFPKGKCELWYPVGYGSQPLNTAKITIFDEVCCPPRINWTLLRRMSSKGKSLMCRHRNLRSVGH